MGTGKERGNEFDPYGDRADSVPVDDAEKATASALNRLLCKLLFISGRLSRQIHYTEMLGTGKESVWVCGCVGREKVQRFNRA